MAVATGKMIQAGRFRTHVHDVGEGAPVVLLHGSGPGVSAWENWSGVIGQLGPSRRVVAPDIVGFGHTEYAADDELDIKVWSRHVLDVLDALELERVVLVGNSFGGGLSLALALRHPDRIAGLVLMGTPSGEFEQTQSLSATGVFEPSPEAMRSLLLTFPYDPKLITDEMVALRHEVSLAHKDNRAFKRLVAPRGEGPHVVRGVPLEQLQKIAHPALILHGREDRVIPLDVAVRTHRHLENSDLVTFGRCGHWVQLERPQEFAQLVRGFLDRLGWGAA